nr:Cd(II)/Pb(II)-responsive transcriptional regulator [Rhodoferax sp.]
MKIGELAQTALCTVETVRYYEKAGLLSEPARTAGNFRVYGSEHLERLRLIRNCRALDMSHEEIHALLKLAGQAGGDCGPINAVFDAHIAHVDTRIRELTQLKQQLSTLRQRCGNRGDNSGNGGNNAVDACGILQGLAAMETGAQLVRHTHLG